MRWTELALMPTTFAIKAAVQWVISAALNEGQHVEFEIEDNRGKTSAVNLRAR
jgi:cold shock CspA family protein